MKPHARREKKKEWARTVSNRRPLVCKTSALPLSYAPSHGKLHADHATPEIVQAARNAANASIQTRWSRGTPGSFISANRITPARSTTKVPRLG